MSFIPACFVLTVDQTSGRSTGPVDRCAQTCTACLASRPVDRAVDRPKSSALWIWPRSIGRSTGGTTVRNLTVGRSPDGRLTAEIPAELSPTVSFWILFIWGSFGLFLTRFEVDFQASFFCLSKYLSPLVLELIPSYQKESLPRVFSTVIS